MVRVGSLRPRNAEIVIPGHHKLVSTTKIQDWKDGTAKSSTNTVSLGENSGAVMDGLPTQIIGSDASHLIDKGTSGVRIQSQARARIHIYDKKSDLMPILDTLHQTVIEQVAAGKYEALATGKLARWLSNRHANSRLSILSELLKTALYQSGTKANFDVMRITLQKDGDQKKLNTYLKVLPSTHSWQMKTFKPLFAVRISPQR